MKKSLFYVYSECGNVAAVSEPMNIARWGKILQPLVGREAKGEHGPRRGSMNEALYIPRAHPTTKTHFIRFVAYPSGDKLHLPRLYPEQGD